MAFVLALALAQESAREWVERLSSDKVEERQDAERKLIALGRAAAPELEKAAKAADQEVAGRARFLLRILEIRERLSPALKEAFPGLEERLAGGEAAYTQALFSAAEKKLKDRDLEALAAPAARGALRVADKEKICAIASEFHLLSAAPEIARYLKDPNQELRGSAALCLGNLGARDHARALLPILMEPDEGTRQCALNSLEELRAHALVPDFEKLLEHGDAGVRADAARILYTLYSRRSEPRLRKLFQDPDPGVRKTALEALWHVDGTLSGDDLLPLLADPDEEVRTLAVDLLSTRTALPLARLLKDPSSRVRNAALRATGASRDVDLLPDLLPLLQVDELRSAALHAIRLLEAAEAAPALLPLLRLKDPGQRGEVVRAAASLRGAGIDVLIRGMEDVDADIRDSAVYALRSLEARSGLPALAKRLKDPSEKVRKNALVAIGAIGRPDPWKELAAALDDAEVAYAAAEALGQIGAVEAVPDLLKTLAHPDAEIRRAAARALWAIRPSEGNAAYAKLLRDPDQSVRLAAADWLSWDLSPAFLASLDDPDPAIRKTSLSALRRPEGIPLLNKGLEDPDPGVQAVAARVLEKIREAAAEEEVEEPSEDPEKKPDEEERRAAIAVWMEALENNKGEVRAVEALAGLGAKEEVLKVLQEVRSLRWIATSTLAGLLGREARPLLLGLLDDPDRRVRSRAMKGLEDLGAAEDVPRFLAMLEDEDDGVRTAALEALGRLGAKEAAPRIALFLDRGRVHVEEAAIQALLALDARDAAPAIGKLLLRDSTNLTSRGLKALVGLRAREAAGDIVRYLASGESYYREEAAEALPLLDARDRIPELMELLKARRPGARAGAAAALGELGAKDAFPAIRPFLQDDDLHVRSAAAFAIGRFGAAEALPDLLRMIDGGGTTDRRAALRAIGALKSKDAVPALLRLSGGGQPDLVRESLNALAEIGAKEAVGEIRRLTRSPHATIRRDAVEALGRMGEITGSPEDLRLLDVDGAAAWLCRAGVLKAAPYLRNRGGGFSELNALRQPAAWKRLETTKVDAPLIGSVREVLRGVAARGGMSLDLPEHFWLVEREIVREGTSLLSALQHNAPHGLEIVLEADRIRFLPVAEASRLWDRWLYEMSRKKK